MVFCRWKTSDAHRCSIREGFLLANKTKQRFSEALLLGKQRLSELWSLGANDDLHNVAGLVINSEYIKLLKIASHNNQNTVEYFAIEKLPVGVVTKNEIKNCQAVATILKNMVDHSGIKIKNIALTIPRSSAIIKHITVDNRLLPDEVESRIWVEANRLFPSLVSDIYLDFSIIGPSAQDMTQNEIVLIACRKEQIRPYLEIMHLVGLNLKVVDINYYALERALSLIVKQLSQLKTFAILNINFSLIDLLVEHENKTIYTHELSYDGYALMQFTQEGLHHQGDMEREKIDVENKIKLDAILKNNLEIHLTHAMQFFYSSRPSIRIEHIIVAGDCAAAIPELARFVQQAVGKEVILANPFKDMIIAPDVDKVKLIQYAPSLMLCCGAALSQLN